MTRYYVNMSPSLVDALLNEVEGYKAPEGWRLVERYGPRFQQTECWIVEDEGAGPEFEDFLVLPTFRMTLIGEGPEYTVTVDDREIVQAP